MGGLRRALDKRLRCCNPAHHCLFEALHRTSGRSLQSRDPGRNSCWCSLTVRLHKCNALVALRGDSLVKSGSATLSVLPSTSKNPLLTSFASVILWVCRERIFCLALFSFMVFRRSDYQHCLVAGFLNQQCARHSNLTSLFPRWLSPSSFISS